MSQATLESIIAQVRALSPDEQRLLHEMLDREAASEQAPKDALLRRIQNKYRRLPTSSEAFATRKPDEIDLEDRRSDNQKNHDFCA